MERLRSSMVYDVLASQARIKDPIADYAMNNMSRKDVIKQIDNTPIFENPMDNLNNCDLFTKRSMMWFRLSYLFNNLIYLFAIAGIFLLGLSGAFFIMDVEGMLPISALLWSLICFSSCMLCHSIHAECFRRGINNIIQSLTILLNVEFFGLI